MPEIGATLREARMRARIDITEVEQATKIRAKYLRAIENEEWTLLPGSTFVKSFLREYADYLDLDARSLVEEYKLRYERPSEQELAPISPNLGRNRPGGGGGGGGPMLPRWAITGLALLAVVLVLALVGSIGGGKDHATPSTAGGTTSTTPTASTHRAIRQRRQSTPATPAVASLRLIPTGTIYVCLVDQAGRVLIAGRTFSAGQQVPLQHARSMRLTLGNNQVRLRVGGRAVAVPASSQAIAYELTRSGARRLPAASAPTCT